MVNGALKMKHVYKAFYGALLVLGLAGISEPALARGYHWDTVCNCRRPDTATARRALCAARRDARAGGQPHQVVRGNTKLIQENRLIVHVRPVINREVVVHRTNTIVKDVLLHRVNTTNKFREEQRHETVNRYARQRAYLERREVRGVNCNCGYRRGLLTWCSH